jgi:hypothetical protein
LDCTMELAGDFLLYEITLTRSGVFLAATPLDDAGALERIFGFKDVSNDWATLQRLVRALEVNAIRSLHPRPLEVGYDGDPRDRWIIA